MLSKEKVSKVKQLHQKKHRDTFNLFLVEGVKMVEEVIKSNWVIKKIFALDEWEIDAKGMNLPVERIDSLDLGRISTMTTPNKVLAIVEKKLPENEFPSKLSPIIALDNLQDPGNIGTIIRIADWFGINQLVLSKDSVDCYHPKLIQASMGSFIRVNVWQLNLQQFLSKHGGCICAAVLDGENLREKTFRLENGVLLVGNESRGIQEELLNLANIKISIPKKGNAESLNAAIATGILLSHIT